MVSKAAAHVERSISVSVLSLKAAVYVGSRTAHYGVEQINNF